MARLRLPPLDRSPKKSSPMQLVGTTCQVCCEKIAIIVGVHGCAQCDKSWHDSCVTGARICPSCGLDVEVSDQKLLEAETAILTGSARVGRLIYFALLASYTIVAAVFLYLTLSARNYYLPFKELGRYAVFAAVWFAAFRGSSGARKTLGVFAVLGFVASLAGFSKIPVMASVIIAHSAFAIWGVWFSSHVRAHERLQNTKTP